MIIVSQDKDIIVNFDNVRQLRCIDNEKQKEIIKNIGLDIFSPLVKQKAGIDIENIKGYGVYAYFDANDNSMLGQYKTESRANEVLQDIVSRYEAIELCKKRPSEILGYTLADYTPVYEMPLE